MTNGVLVCPYKNYFLGKDDVGRSKFNSRKEGVRGLQREAKNEKGGGSDKDPTYSLCGRGVLHRPSARRAEAETLEQQSPERKSSPSCWLLMVPAACRRISPLLPTCPHRAERISMTFSAAPEQLIHDGSLPRSRSGGLLSYTAESQREAEGFVLVEFTHRVFWV